MNSRPYIMAAWIALIAMGVFLSIVWRYQPTDSAPEPVGESVKSEGSRYGTYGDLESGIEQINRITNGIDRRRRLTTLANWVPTNDLARGLSKVGLVKG